MAPAIIVLLFGPAAEQLAHHLAKPGDVVFRADALLMYPSFEPLARTFIWAGDQKGVTHWRKNCAALIWAGERHANINKGSFGGHRQGAKFNWRDVA